MSTPDARLDAVVALLCSVLGKVETRTLMGATGLYLDGAQFGIVNEGRLLFRADAQNRADYEAFETKDAEDFCPRSAMPGDLPWRPVPGPVLDDEDLLADWARKAWEAAKRARKAQA